MLIPFPFSNPRNAKDREFRAILYKGLDLRERLGSTALPNIFRHYTVAFSIRQEALRACRFASCGRMSGGHVGWTAADFIAVFW
jgi:hypothetical protein